MTSLPLATGLGEAPEAVSRRTIPYDYAFRYLLTGKPGHVLSKTVVVSIEASFTAVSIGYGVIPKARSIVFGPRLPPAAPAAPVVAALPPLLERIGLAPVIRGLEEALVGEFKAARATRRFPRQVVDIADVLRTGIRINPKHLNQVLLPNVVIDPKVLGELFEGVRPPPDLIQFLYAVRDEATGREFQSEPILNTAGLGIADGDRPFRYVAVPITFAPRSIIRLEVTELSEFPGELHVALHGYRVLGGAGTPTGRIRRRRARERR